ncbi:MAG: C40 family peptidase [Bacteroidales bacterium]|nr:C40 family peptidase [Bacteroidales bacterium]
MRKASIIGILLLAVLSCGTVRQKPAPVQLPLEDPAEIARSQARAQAVLDSLDRIEKGRDTSTAPVQTQPAEAPTKKAESLEDQVIAYARSFTGTPYKLGATGPKQFDCSGFTSYVFKHFGYALTAYSQAQFREGREVSSFADLKKGDLVFFGKRGSVRTIGHVGIIVSIEEEKGSFTFIHASVSKGVTEESSSSGYFLMRYMGARRILPD